MEHHNTYLTLWLNKLLGPQVNALLHAMGIHPHDPATPIPEFVVMSILVFVLLAVFTLWLKPRLSVDRPGASQQVMEFLLTNPINFGIRDLLDSNVGHGGRRYVPVVGSVALFILLSNLLSVIPAFTSPTAHPSVPLACALITFAYFNFQGCRAQGVGWYLAHFAGAGFVDFAHRVAHKEVRGPGGFLKEGLPATLLAALLFPVELISTTARVLSLTVRLWANMFASELLYFIFLGLTMGPALYFGQKNAALGWVLGLFPATIPVLFIGLHIFVAVIQTFVFTILPSIYLGMATAEEH
jgi:F-type H+-transporting ATPase subunit a